MEKILTKSLLLRCVTSLVAGSVVLLCLWLGGVVWLGLLVLCFCVGGFEWVRLSTSQGLAESNMLSEGSSLRLWDYLLVIVGALYLASACLGFLALRLDGFGIGEGGFAMSVFDRREFGEKGFFVIVQLIILVIVSDSAAYFGGKLIGGRKLCPRISPNKTYAGLWSGWLATLIVGVVVFGDAIMGVLVCPISQLGDCAISALKRRAGVKDSGRILPGHGGLLDRLDGYLPFGVLIFIFFYSGIL